MSNHARLSKARILLVDDDEGIRDILQTILETEGYSVQTAKDGRSAQDLAGLGNFSAVLSDIHMPGSPISGIELLGFIKRTIGIPVILMTGFSALTETRDAYELGAKGFLAKPFRSEELLALLRKVLAPPPGEVAGARQGERSDRDEEFRKIRIDDFVSGKEIKYDIYIRFKQAGSGEPEHFPDQKGADTQTHGRFDHGSSFF